MMDNWIIIGGLASIATVFLVCLFRFLDWLRSKPSLHFSLDHNLREPVSIGCSSGPQGRSISYPIGILVDNKSSKSNTVLSVNLKKIPDRFQTKTVRIHHENRVQVNGHQMQHFTIRFDMKYKNEYTSASSETYSIEVEFVDKHKTCWPFKFTYKEA